MASVRVPVTKEILQWAVKQSDKDPDETKRKFAIDQWLEKEKVPTVNQLKDLSAHLQIPFGYFMLKKPSKEGLSLLDYRTIKTKGVDKPSRNLLDTIEDMKRKQNWMRDYLIDNGYGKLPFVGAIKEEIDQYEEQAKRIRKDLGLDKNRHQKVTSSEEAFNYLKQQISDAGILVMQNGVVLNNSRRKLDVEEFRAFTLIDDYASLIFINAKDTRNGKIFSLFHEIAHIFIGESSLYNDTGYYNETDYSKDIEVHCNAIAAELLVPNESFLERWNNTNDIPKQERIEELASTFKASKIVIARKALDHYKINLNIYHETVTKTMEEYSKRNNEKSDGGHYYNTAQSRLDHRFFKALASDVKDRKTLNTTAYQLTGLNRYTFENLGKFIDGEDG